ncbi:hypothetical protein GCM10009605_11820 [Nocardiopsis composta]
MTVPAVAIWSATVDVFSVPPMSTVNRWVWASAMTRSMTPRARSGARERRSSGSGRGGAPEARGPDVDVWDMWSPEKPRFYDMVDGVHIRSTRMSASK